MKRADRLKRALLGGVVALTSIAVLSGCGYSQLRPLPDKERYAKINAVKNELDYKSAGQVEKEEYDNGDGVFAPSYFRVKLYGENTFNTLGKRLEHSSHITCGWHIDTTYSCNASGVVVTLTRENAASAEVVLGITDSMNGRRGH